MGDWVCSKCTYQNRGKLTGCEMCGTSKAKSMQKAQEREDDGFGTKSAKKKDSKKERKADRRMKTGDGATSKKKKSVSKQEFGALDLAGSDEHGGSGGGGAGIGDSGNRRARERSVSAGPKDLEEYNDEEGGGKSGKDKKDKMGTRGRTMLGRLKGRSKADLAEAVDKDSRSSGDSGENDLNWREKLNTKRSIRFFLDNACGATLIRQGPEPRCVSGSWARVPPPHIENGEREEFGVYCKQKMPGLKGAFSYSLGENSNALFHFSFSSTKDGKADVDCQSPPQFIVEKSGDITKNAVVRFKIISEGHAAGGKRSRSHSKHKAQPAQHLPDADSDGSHSSDDEANANKIKFSIKSGDQSGFNGGGPVGHLGAPPPAASDSKRRRNASFNNSPSPSQHLLEQQQHLGLNLAPGQSDNSDSLQLSPRQMHQQQYGAEAFSAARQSVIFNEGESVKEASDQMKQCAARLEAGQFKEALPFVDTALSMIVTQGMQNLAPYLPNIVVCTHYKLALHVLISLKEWEAFLGADKDREMLIRRRIGLLTHQLTTLRLSPKHKAVCLRMAITKNMEALNYGFASQLLQFLLSLRTPDAPLLNAKLQACLEAGATDADETHMIPVYCARDFKPIDDFMMQGLLACQVCQSTYSTSAAGCSPGNICWLCCIGTLIALPPPSALQQQPPQQQPPQQQSQQPLQPSSATASPMVQPYHSNNSSQSALSPPTSSGFSPFD